MHRPVLVASVVGLGVVAGLASFGGASATASVAADGAYTVDNVHSSVLFSVRHNNVSNFYGRFNKVEGSFNIAEGGSVDVKVDTGSIDTANEGRDKHLRSGEIFSATEFPTITFKSSSLKKTGENTYEATGELTLRGTKKPLTVTITDTGRGVGRGNKSVAGFETKFAIKRSEFGVSYGVGPGLSDEVQMIVSLQGAQ
ncbi:MAG TPA: YceI family protein [Phycisphaerales bacterium]